MTRREQKHEDGQRRVGADWLWLWNLKRIALKLKFYGTGAIWGTYLWSDRGKGMVRR